MKKHLIIVVLLFLSVNIFSESWKEYIPVLTAEDISALESDKYADRARVNYKNGLELLPSNSSIAEDLYKSVSKYDPELCVEMLYVMDKPEVSNEDLAVYLLNNLRAFSDQAGLEYYSSNRKKMYPLIKKSYFVSEDRKNKLNDPVVKEVPSYEKHFYFQDDSSFGANYYQLITRSSDNGIWLQMENLDSLKVLSMFKAVEKHGERVNFLLTTVENKLVIYALAEIKEEPKIKKVLVYKVNIPGSFKRRMDTLIGWFKKRVE